MCSGGGVNKMERVVDSLMCVACCSCQLVVGAPLVTSLNPTKHPVSIHNSAMVVLSLPKYTFIDFNFNPWPADHSRMSQKVLRTNIAHKVVPVHSGGTAYLQYAICLITFTVLIYTSNSSCAFPTGVFTDHM